jgi:uncharacterized delta-60 repeat protein
MSAAVRRGLGAAAAGALLACLLPSSAAAQDGTYDVPWGFGAGHAEITIGPDGGGVRRLLMQPDGKPLLLGTCAGGPCFCAARLQAHGQIDTSFGGNQDGTAVFNLLRGELADAAALPGGSTVLVGTDHASSAGLIARMTATGFNDLSTTLRVRGLRTHVDAVAVQPDGKILVGGDALADPDPHYSADTDFFVARLQSDFSLDPAFGDGGIANVWFDLGADRTDRFGALLLLPDGRIVLAGTAESDTGTWPVLARLLPSGQLDAAFGSGGRQVFTLWSGAVATVAAMARYPGDRIVLAGDVNGSTSRDMYVIRALSDGALDASFGFFGYAPVAFDAGGDDADFGRALAVQADGRILVAGEVDTDVDTEHNFLGSLWGMARMRANGAYDPTFGNAGQATNAFAAPSDPAYANEIASIVIDRGRLMVAGRGMHDYPSDLGPTRHFGVGRLRFELIFADGLE